MLRNLPRTFTLGVRTVETARFLDVIRAVGSVTRPSVDPQAQLRLSMGIVNLQRMVTAKIGREVVPGALNAIVKNIYGRHSKHGSFNIMILTATCLTPFPALHTTPRAPWHVLYLAPVSIGC